MAVLPPSKDERDANLDALKEAVSEYTSKEQERLENEVKFMRAVLDGRGISEAAAKNLDEFTALVAKEISSFLSG